MEQAQLVEAIGGAADVPAASTLINPHCIEPEITEETELDVLALAELQQKHTVEYNKKLDLHTSVAIALAGKMLPELEEKYGIDPVDVLEQEWVDPRSLPDLIDEAGLEGDLLSAIEDGMRWCVDEFTELTSLDENGQEVTKKLDADAARKIVRKSISQPTALTKCVMDLLCFEVADDSGRGLYRIRWCTIPSRKSYGIVDNQRVVSWEEIVDELLNVCTSMEESGQLLEHNKTKDARDHKLMNVKFADKFSYSMSVWFKPLVDSADPAHEKRMAIENNAYLMDTLLGIDEELMHEEQRNKYVTLYNATQTATTEGINTVDQNVWQAAALQRAELGTPQLPRDMQSQLLTHPQVFEVLNEYLDQSTDHWIYMNDITHSIMQLWHAEMQETQQKG